MAILINSVGYPVYYPLLFERIGIRRTRITWKHLNHLDNCRQWKAQHDKKQHIKKRHKIKFNEKIKLANKQIRKDQRKGCTYKSGMLGPQVPNVVDNEQRDLKEQSKVSATNPKQKKMKRIPSVCKLCQGTCKIFTPAVMQR
jgi:hypothetical protein